MDIDFTKHIIKQKELDTLYKPFPTESGYALFAKIEGELVKVLFSTKEMVEQYLDDLGFDWGPRKGEYTNFDTIIRILHRYPELKAVKEVQAVSEMPEGGKAIEPQEIMYRGKLWKIVPTNESMNLGDVLGADKSGYPGQNVPKKKDGSPKKKKEKRECKKGEHRGEDGDLKKTKETDSHRRGRWHQHGRPANYAKLWKMVNEPSTTTSKKKLPPWMDKDKKKGKDGDKDGDKNGDKKEKGKDGKKLPPWLNKKKKK